MLSTESEQLLKEIYYNVNPPAGFSNASQLYHAVKGKGIKFQDVHKFLSRQCSHQLTRPNHHNCTRCSTVSRGLDHFWEADLEELAHDAYSRGINKGVNFLLTVINMLSRYAWVIPLKTKSAQSVSTALETIFVTPQRWPNYLTTDEGKEFYNSYVKKLQSKYKVHHFSVYSHMKSSLSERFNCKWNSQIQRCRPFFGIGLQQKYSYRNKNASSGDQHVQCSGFGKTTLWSKQCLLILPLRRDSPSKIIPDFLCATL